MSQSPTEFVEVENGYSHNILTVIPHLLHIGIPTGRAPLIHVNMDRVPETTATIPIPISVTPRGPRVHDKVMNALEKKCDSYGKLTIVSVPELEYIVGKTDLRKKLADLRESENLQVYVDSTKRAWVLLGRNVARYKLTNNTLFPTKGVNIQLRDPSSCVQAEMLINIGSDSILSFVGYQYTREQHNLVEKYLTEDM